MLQSATEDQLSPGSPFGDDDPIFFGDEQPLTYAEWKKYEAWLLSHGLDFIVAK